MWWWKEKEKGWQIIKYPQGYYSLGAFYYLFFFVKYTHPTTVAPNIDIVATKGSWAIAKPTVDGLVGRKGPGVEYDKVTMIDTDIAVPIVDEEKAKDGGTWLKCKSGYYVNKKYMKFVRYV